MTKYLDKTFSSPPNSKQYRDNWERVFGEHDKFSLVGKRAELEAVVPGFVTIDGLRYDCVDSDGIRVMYQGDWYNPESGEYDLDSPNERWEVRFRHNGDTKLYVVIMVSVNCTAEMLAREVAYLEAPKLPPNASEYPKDPGEG